MEIIISVCLFAVLGWVLALFLCSEFLKKFGFVKNFIGSSNQLLVWEYQGDRTPMMHNIVLRGGKPFAVLVGFELRILGYKGFDYYGFVRSDEHGVVVISTYLGKGQAKFQFFVNCDLGNNPVTVESTKGDQALRPAAVYPPHWWQKLGFYA